MDWLKRIRGSDEPPAPEPKPQDAAAPTASLKAGERGKGLAAQAREKSEEYKEALGLLQQFADKGLEKLRATSDYQLGTPSMEDTAEYKGKTSRGNVIQIRVPGRNAAKELQRMVREAMGLDAEESSNPLQRQKREGKRDGQNTYLIFINTDRVPAARAREILEKALLHMKIQPDWQTHYVRYDPTPVSKEERANRQRQEEMNENANEGDDLTPAERAARSRYRLDEGGGISRA
jgi:hypothetical protein